jgi:hypothetical protein
MAVLAPIPQRSEFGFQPQQPMPDDWLGKTLAFLGNIMNAPGADALIGGPMGFVAKNSAKALQQVRNYYGMPNPNEAPCELGAIADKLHTMGKHYEATGQGFFEPGWGHFGSNSGESVRTYLPNSGVARTIPGPGSREKATSDAWESIKQSEGWSPEQLQAWLSRRQR